VSARTEIKLFLRRSSGAVKQAFSSIFVNKVLLWPAPHRIGMKKLAICANPPVLRPVPIVLSGGEGGNIQKFCLYSENKFFKILTLKRNILTKTLNRPAVHI
jgi:hypothetical protein